MCPRTVLMGTIVNMFPRTTSWEPLWRNWRRLFLLPSARRSKWMARWWRSRARCCKPGWPAASPCTWPMRSSWRQWEKLVLRPRLQQQPRHQHLFPRRQCLCQPNTWCRRTWSFELAWVPWNNSNSKSRISLRKHSLCPRWLQRIPWQFQSPRCQSQTAIHKPRWRWWSQQCKSQRVRKRTSRPWREAVSPRALEPLGAFETAEDIDGSRQGAHDNWHHDPRKSGAGMRLPILGEHHTAFWWISNVWQGCQAPAPDPRQRIHDSCSSSLLWARDQFEEGRWWHQDAIQEELDLSQLSQEAGNQRRCPRSCSGLTDARSHGSAARCSRFCGSCLRPEFIPDFKDGIYGIRLQEVQLQERLRSWNSNWHLHAPEWPQASCSEVCLDFFALHKNQSIAELVHENRMGAKPVWAQGQQRPQARWWSCWWTLYGLGQEPTDGLWVGMADQCCSWMEVSCHQAIAEENGSIAQTCLLVPIPWMCLWPWIQRHSCAEGLDGFDFQPQALDEPSAEVSWPQRALSMSWCCSSSFGLLSGQDGSCRSPLHCWHLVWARCKEQCGLIQWHRDLPSGLACRGCDRPAWRAPCPWCQGPVWGSWWVAWPLCLEQDFWSSGTSNRSQARADQTADASDSQGLWPHFLQQSSETFESQERSCLECWVGWIIAMPCMHWVEATSSTSTCIDSWWSKALRGSWHWHLRVRAWFQEAQTDLVERQSFWLLHHQAPSGIWRQLGAQHLHCDQQLHSMADGQSKSDMDPHRLRCAIHLWGVSEFLPQQRYWTYDRTGRSALDFGRWRRHHWNFESLGHQAPSWGTGAIHWKCLCLGMSWCELYHRAQWIFGLSMGTRRCHSSGSNVVWTWSQESLWWTSAFERESPHSLWARTCEVQALTAEQCTWAISFFLYSRCSGDDLATTDEAR